jgi:hypothetical protein
MVLFKVLNLSQVFIALDAPLFGYRNAWLAI